MHAFYHNQDPKLSRLSTENILQEKKGIEPHIAKKIITPQLSNYSEKNFTSFRSCNYMAENQIYFSFSRCFCMQLFLRLVLDLVHTQAD